MFDELRKSGLNFNPRPREEGDNVIYDEGGWMYISIHALVKRATEYANQARPPSINFNPRPREEGDV